MFQAGGKRIKRRKRIKRKKRIKKKERKQEKRMFGGWWRRAKGKGRIVEKKQEKENIETCADQVVLNNT